MHIFYTAFNKTYCIHIFQYKHRTIPKEILDKQTNFFVILLFNPLTTHNHGGIFNVIAPQIQLLDSKYIDLNTAWQEIKFCTSKQSFKKRPQNQYMIITNLNIENIIFIYVYIYIYVLLHLKLLLFYYSKFSSKFTS